MEELWQSSPRYHGIVSKINEYKREMETLTESLYQLPADYKLQLNENQELFEHWKNNFDFPHDILWTNEIYQYNVPTERPGHSHNVLLTPAYFEYSTSADNDYLFERWSISVHLLLILFKDLEDLFKKPLKPGYLLGISNRTNYQNRLICLVLCLC